MVAYCLMLSCTLFHLILLRTYLIPTLWVRKLKLTFKGKGLPEAMSVRGRGEKLGVVVSIPELIPLNSVMDQRDCFSLC